MTNQKLQAELFLSSDTYHYRLFSTVIEVPSDVTSPDVWVREELFTRFEQNGSTVPRAGLAVCIAPITE